MKNKKLALVLSAFLATYGTISFADTTKQDEAIFGFVATVVEDVVEGVEDVVTIVEDKIEAKEEAKKESEEVSAA